MDLASSLPVRGRVRLSLGIRVSESLGVRYAVVADRAWTARSDESPALSYLPDAMLLYECHRALYEIRWIFQLLVGLDGDPA